MLACIDFADSAVWIDVLGHHPGVDSLCERSVNGSLIECDLSHHVRDEVRKQLHGLFVFSAELELYAACVLVCGDEWTPV